MTPAEFKTYYENSHMPLVQRIGGVHFPKSHTRSYIQRSEVDTSATSTGDGENAKYPATVLIGNQAEFDYDSVAELVFEDQTHFQLFMGAISENEAAKTLAADEEKFLDRGKMRAVMVDERNVMTPAKTG